MIDDTIHTRKNLLPANGLQAEQPGNNGTTLVKERRKPEILFITSWPPRECGIATYSYDLVSALDKMFGHSFTLTVCPLESDQEKHTYKEKTKFSLNADWPGALFRLAQSINHDTDISMVVVQHEFGFFKKTEADFTRFLRMVNKPVLIVFHTVLPKPDAALRSMVQEMAGIAESVIVMTHSSAAILVAEYDLPVKKIKVIPHGTHLVVHADKQALKHKYKLTGRKVLSTFGLLGSGKNIETTLHALPGIIQRFPDVLFLVIGKTHPSVVKQDGEQYRDMLEMLVNALGLEAHVLFINKFLPLPELLEYLQLTDIYLFTSRDRNQAVSGTFAYAAGSGCPVISTPIPHAREVLGDNAGIIIDFEQPVQLAEAVNRLLDDETLRLSISSNGLHRMASTAWENAAIAHALLFEQIGGEKISLRYTMPVINLEHLKKMTTDFGMLQFCRINNPDPGSGYTLDDNARALIALCSHYELTKDAGDLEYIQRYFKFIKYCLQPGGFFLNYINEKQAFTAQNGETNLADSNGRAIWALGYLVSKGGLLPAALVQDALLTMNSALLQVRNLHSTRAMAFVIKGVYYRNTVNVSDHDKVLIEQLANRLLQMYRHEAGQGWQWFESYLTYANGILPEAMLCAWQATGNEVYKEVARSSFDFLLKMTFGQDRMQVISNKNWFYKGAPGGETGAGGEQPIDVAYTILALLRFYDVFKSEAYRHKIEIAFSWFLGNNHLHQVIYNPCTGGCYDGLEADSVNLNQGAESTVSYLMARVAIEQYINKSEKKAKPATRRLAKRGASL